MQHLDLSGAPNGSFPQNICSSGKSLLAGRFGNNMCHLEGKCCCEINNSWSLRGFYVSLLLPIYIDIDFYRLTTPG